MLYVRGCVGTKTAASAGSELVLGKVLRLGKAYACENYCMHGNPTSHTDSTVYIHECTDVLEISDNQVSSNDFPNRRPGYPY